MKQEDRISFVYSIEREMHDHEEGGHWTVVHRNTLPNKAFPIKPIFSLKKNHKPYGEILKNKYRLCAHGGMQQWGDIYWENYFPVVNMLNLRLILAIAKIYSLDSKAIDFVMDFPKAGTEKDILIQLPIGFQVVGQTESDSDKKYVLKLNKISMG